MLLFIEQNTVTKNTDLIIQTTLKKLQKNNKINCDMKIHDRTNQDSQGPMTMDNTKAENKLFTKSNYMTYRRDPLRDSFAWYGYEENVG